MRNPHQYKSLRIAAEAGIAPKLVYVDETRGIAVMDFIEAQPLRDYPGGPGTLAAAVGLLLRRLQDAPLFPYFVDYPDIVTRLFEHVRRTGLFADGLLDPYAERLERIRESWPRVTPVSSHNDPNPRNILYDGERLWLIDWESAYRNDPLVDVAIVLDNLAPSPELEDVLLPIMAWPHAGRHGSRASGACACAQQALVCGRVAERVRDRAAYGTGKGFVGAIRAAIPSRPLAVSH